MTATYITVGQSVWGIACLFAMALIRGSSDRIENERLDCQLEAQQ